MSHENTVTFHSHRTAKENQVEKAQGFIGQEKPKAIGRSNSKAQAEGEEEVMARKSNFGGKKAAPFTKGGRKKSYPRTHKGTVRKKKGK